FLRSDRQVHRLEAVGPNELSVRGAQASDRRGYAGGGRGRMKTEYHREVLAQLRAEAATPAYNMPPPMLDTLGGVIVDFLPMRSLHCEFPVARAHDGIG